MMACLYIIERNENRENMKRFTRDEFFFPSHFFMEMILCQRKFGTLYFSRNYKSVPFSLKLV